MNPGQIAATIVDKTIRLLAETGPTAVRARQISSAAGVSTMALYQHFEGMPGLLEAVRNEGFVRLGERFAEAPRSDDPAADAARLALVNRAVALENPHLYDLMFGLSNPGGFLPPRASQDEAFSPWFEAAYGQLVAVAVDLVESGRVRPDDPRVVAAQLWCFVHGYITLELAGHMNSFDDAVMQVFLPLAVNVMTGLGDQHERALASALAAAGSAPRQGELEAGNRGGLGK